MTYIVAAFYHFFDFPHYAGTRPALLALLKQYNIKGSLLVAPEGFNGTLSGTREDIDQVLDYLKREIVKSEFEHKESFSDKQPFGRAKVRLKKELISLGEPAFVCHPRLERGSHATRHSGPGSPLKAGMTVGNYVEPKDWNALIADPDVTVIDARNSYEVHLGTFERALNPAMRNFKQLPAYVKKHLNPAKHKKIATFCTGGIRCEKFTAWLKQEGFKEVYHLKGGILKYLEEIPAAESKWQGECYVFDERVAVGHRLAASFTATMCPACGHALTVEDRKHSLYIENTRCLYCGNKPR